MPSTPSIVAESAGAPFTQREIPQREVGPHDVLIDIAYAGICHSDVHQVREEWGAGGYFPMVPGHEIAGVISAIGAEVNDHQVGDRVGVGCMVDSCRTCEYCLEGFEQMCTKGAVMTYNGLGYDGHPTYGGYAKSVVVDQRFACPIPDGIDLAEAAPLLCAGITTYSPLRRWGTAPGKKVAVVGLGGLGHMAVKLAAAMGAEVTVLSRTTAKAADSLALGATDHLATSDGTVFGTHANRFDLIINTVSADIDMGSYLRLVRPNGAVVNVGLPTNSYSLHPFALTGGNKVLAGSNIGGIAETKEMLAFCADNGIGAQVEVISADQVDAAYDTVVAGQAKYRFVIDTATIADDDA